MRVLLVRLSAMGDLVQSLGAVASLRAVRPDWHLTFVTQAAWAPLLDGLPGLDRVVRFDRWAGLGGVLRLRRDLHRTPFDAALDLQGNWKSALVTWLSGARDRIGLSPPGRQEPGSRVLLRRLVASPAAPHPAEAAWALVRQLAPDAPFRRPVLRAADAELERERAALRQLGVDPDRPMRLLVLTDRADIRSLPEAMLRDAAGGAAAAVGVAGPDFEPAADLAWLPVLRHGRGEPRRLVALGAVVAAAGGTVVGPDRGPTHVLAATGAAVAAVFGSQDPRRSAPPAARAIARPDPPACQPCRRRVCRNPAGRVCMDFGLAAGRAVEIGLPPDGAPAPGQRHGLSSGS